jgi:hypothetical protein
MGPIVHCKNTELSLDGNNLIFPDQGKWQTFLTVYTSRAQRKLIHEKNLKSKNLVSDSI